MFTEMSLSLGNQTNKTASHEIGRNMRKIMMD